MGLGDAAVVGAGVVVVDGVGEEYEVDGVGVGDEAVAAGVGVERVIAVRTALSVLAVLIPP